MIITFESISGGGKTTQALPLSKKIDFKPVTFFEELRAVRILLDPVREGSRSHIFPLSANTMLLNSVSESNRKNVIIHDPQFLCYLHPFFKVGSVSQPFIKTWLDWLHTTYLVPVASFCLKVDYDIVNNRADRRLYDLEDVSSLFQFYDYLDSILPYFYIIDGTQDIETIADEIERILRGIDGITFFHR